MKVTNLEKFALEQLIRPYASAYDPKYSEFRNGSWHHFPVKSLPDSLEVITNRLIAQNCEWSKMVKNRLIKFRHQFIIPRYIKHPLVNFIRMVNEEMGNQPSETDTEEEEE